MNDVAGEALGAQALSYARIAKNTWLRKLVFQRLPKAGEQQTDKRGFPVGTYTDIDAQHPIPCSLAARMAREVEVLGKTRTTTVYEFTIPKLYETANEIGARVFMKVDFHKGYRLKLLADEYGNAEQVMHVIDGAPDPGPAIRFMAVELENTA